jgi:hypothetical protein
VIAALDFFPLSFWDSCECKEYLPQGPIADNQRGERQRDRAGKPHRVMTNFVDVVEDVSGNETDSGSDPSLETVHHLLDLGVIVHDLDVKLDIFCMSVVLHPVPVTGRDEREREGRREGQERFTELLIRRQVCLAF